MEIHSLRSKGPGVGPDDSFVGDSSFGCGWMSGERGCTTLSRLVHGCRLGTLAPLTCRTPSVSPPPPVQSVGGPRTTGHLRFPLSLDSLSWTSGRQKVEEGWGTCFRKTNLCVNEYGAFSFDSRSPSKVSPRPSSVPGPWVRGRVFFPPCTTCVSSQTRRPVSLHPSTVLFERRLIPSPVRSFRSGSRSRL